MTAVSFHVLFNFSTGADSYYASLPDALRAVDHIGSGDTWVIRTVVGGAVTQVAAEGRGPQQHDGSPGASS